jgi:peptidoglycan/xylan/chitin deacetylase (PgdA/CDA1 family)
MYHRIAELKHDPWQLAVTPDNFEQQLNVLRRIGKLVSVKELVASLHKRTIPDGSICITFDDGYRDNYFSAKPLLEKYKFPATFFIPTYYIDRDQHFWWDELENILLDYPELPTKFSLSVEGNLLEFNLEEDARLTADMEKKHSAWAWPEPPPTRRCELYLALWEKLKPLSFDELQLKLYEIKQWVLFREPAVKEGLPMTLEQLNELTTHQLIDLGLHTHTHPALPCHSEAVQLSEISTNSKYFENIDAKILNTIAYPYGNFNAVTLSVVKKLQLNAAFTTTAKIVSNLSDPYQIGRFQVGNWNGIEFEKSLLNWKKASQFL